MEGSGIFEFNKTNAERPSRDWICAIINMGNLSET
jgi:hypothetical protein